jgi:hypothetical protein
VHGVVDEREPAARRAEIVTRVPAVDQDRGVVVPVEEDELLLARHNEECVEEFGHFAQYEQPSLRKEKPDLEFISFSSLINLIRMDFFFVQAPLISNISLLFIGDFEHPNYTRINFEFFFHFKRTVLLNSIRIIFIRIFFFSELLGNYFA